MKTVCVAMLLGLLFLAGCNEPFAVGVATGITAKIVEANVAMSQLDKDVAALQAKSKELSAVIKADPMTIVGAVDPNLKPAVEAFVVNAKALADRAEDFKTQKGKVDWERIILIGLLGIFGGGTGVNLYKNGTKP